MGIAIRHDATPPDEPILVVALEGWMDAGFAAQTATAILLEGMTKQPFVTFPGDGLIDYRARRPRLRIDDGVRMSISWPEPTITVGTDRNGAGIAVLGGPEPDFRWHGFAEEVSDLAVEMNVRLVVGLGAFPNATPHTRPIKLASTSSDADYSRRIGFVAGSLDVPSGIGDVIGDACSNRGIPSVGLWARVPHYIAAMPVPAAALALLEGLHALSGIAAPTEELARSAEQGLRQVDELIAQSEEHTNMVRELEAQFESGNDPSEIFDEGSIEGDGTLPTGDEIAAELERYLRGEP